MEELWSEETVTATSGGCWLIAVDPGSEDWLRDAPDETAALRRQHARIKAGQQIKLPGFARPDPPWARAALIHPGGNLSLDSEDTEPRLIRAKGRGERGWLRACLLAGLLVAFGAWFATEPSCADERAAAASEAQRTQLQAQRFAVFYLAPRAEALERQARDTLGRFL